MFLKRALLSLLLSNLVCFGAKRPSVIIGIEGRGAPMSYYDAGRSILTGFDVELAREVCFRLDLEPIFYNTYWQRIFRDLQEKHIDLVWSGMSITPERQAIYKISQPYHRSKLVVAVSANSPIQHIEQLKNGKIGYLTGTTTESVLRAHPILGPELTRGLTSLVPHSSSVSGFMDLTFGLIDAFVIDDFAVYLFSPQPVERIPIRILADSLHSQGLGIAARQSDAALISQIDSVLVVLEQEGIIQRLRQVWFNPIYYQRLLQNKLESP